MVANVVLTGHDLDPERLAAIARGGARVELDPGARDRIIAAHRLLLAVAAAGEPIYGVTTGLGARVVDPVSDGQGAEFSLRTLRGRATAVGEPLPTQLVRAAMAVRLNGLCAGGAGASLAVAEGLASLLNAGVHPVIPGSGSVGASDLCLLAHMGLVLVAEGEAEYAGKRLTGAQALAQAGLSPVLLEAKDGLALCSSSAVSAGAAALALLDGQALLGAAQAATALSMEALRANLSPIDPRVAQARPAPGQEWAAAGLRRLLSESGLWASGAARRLQDPLSFRCASQIHGALYVALGMLAGGVSTELSGIADNPIVLVDDREVLSTGNFHVPALALALDAVAIAVAQAAAPMGERSARLRSERVSGLPAQLVQGDTTHSGVGPLGKTGQALILEIRHLAAPLAIQASVGADGIEDDSTGAAQAALRVATQLERFRHLVAIEMLVAAQALDIRPAASLGAGAAILYRRVREIVSPLTEDRPLGPDVARLADALAPGSELMAELDQFMATAPLPAASTLR